MRKIKGFFTRIKEGARNSDGYKIESEAALKLKQILRDFRTKRAFYMEHSKFATYEPEEYLSAFREEIIEYSKSWIRMSQKNMSAEKNPGIEGHANMRMLHVLDAAEIARTSAKELLLNEDLAYIQGAIHDIGHTAFAHEGESWLSKIMQKDGICELHHSSLSRLVLEIEQIHDRVLNEIEKRKGRPLTEREKRAYRKAYLDITDGAVCHNGEGGLTEIDIKRDKTDEDVEKEYINTFVEKGFDKKTKNRTKEGAIVLFADPISYVAKDFRDGVIKGLVNVDDSRYEEIFTQMGLDRETLDRWRIEGGKKDKIVSWVTRRLRNNLIQRSRNIDGIKMDKSLANLMYQLRDLNYDQVVKPGLRKINDILPERLPVLIDRYAEMLIEYENDKTDGNINLNQHRAKMLKKFTAKRSRSVEAIYNEIVRKGTEKSVTEEVEAILNGLDEPRTNRRDRLEKDLQEIREEYGEISKEIKEGYVQRVLKEISLSPKESKEMLKKRIKKDNPEASKEEVEKLARENGNLRLQTYTEALAKLKVTVYIGESSNDFLLDMLEAEGLLTKDEKGLRYVAGGNVENSSIVETQKAQKAEKAAEQAAQQGKKEEPNDGQPSGGQPGGDER